ncbi:MAG: hypothetical protein J6H18_01525 [Lachnospiraceae bacterium]|nr:hypothetical protein [Lachnospiraceae bacterium]
MNRAEGFIREVISRKELGHAYLFESPVAGEANAVMRRMARLMACENKSSCGSCASCRAFDRGNHPDIISLVKEKSAYGAREIREQLVEDIAIRPYRFEHKIYLIPDAETLSPLCQNVLLKTLEEPPSYGVILLAAVSRSVFLPTVLSRLVCLSSEEGEAGEGESSGRDRILEFTAGLRSTSAAECLVFFQELQKKGMDAQEQMQVFRDILRDIYTAKGGAEGKMLFPEYRDIWKEYARDLSDAALKKLWNKTTLAGRQIKANLKGGNIISSFALSLRDALSESEDLS